MIVDELPARRRVIWRFSPSHQFPLGHADVGAAGRKPHLSSFGLGDTGGLSFHRRDDYDGEFSY